jgi:hypothetical protein
LDVTLLNIGRFRQINSKQKRRLSKLCINNARRSLQHALGDDCKLTGEGVYDSSKKSEVTHLASS